MTTEKTLQDVLNHVVAFMRRQGCRAVSDSSCQYLDTQGRQCAVGCLVPRGLAGYIPEGEVYDHDTWEVLQGLLAFDAWPTSDKAREFYRELQRAHDHAPPDNWLAGFESRACFVADELGLSYPK